MAWLKAHDWRIRVLPTEKEIRDFMVALKATGISFARGELVFAYERLIPGTTPSKHRKKGKQKEDHNKYTHINAFYMAYLLHSLGACYLLQDPDPLNSVFCFPANQEWVQNNKTLNLFDVGKKEQFGVIMPVRID